MAGTSDLTSFTLWIIVTVLNSGKSAEWLTTL